MQKILKGKVFLVI